MRITWNELTIPFEADQCDRLLSEWRWLVGDEVQLQLVSALGDLFLSYAEGRILWLDIGMARLTRVADSADEFKQFIQQVEHAEEWFVPQLIGDLIVNGQRLGPGQCYSYTIPPMLSGKLEVDNFKPTDLVIHCSMFGQIGRQIQGLPEGTQIRKFSTTEEEEG